MLNTDTIEVTQELLALLSEIDEFKGAWRALGTIARERLNALRRVATIESIGSSTRIEGSKLTDREVERLLGNLEIKRFSTRDEQEVAGYAEVMETIFRAWPDIPVTENHIKQLHRDLLRYSDKDAANIKVFRDTHDIEVTGKVQKPRDQFAASDIAVAAEAFITNNAQASQKEVAEDLLEKDSGYTSTGVDVGDIADVVYMLKRVAQDIHPLMLLVYADEPGKKYYFSGGGTFLTGFTAACGYVRNRNNMKMLEGALEKLILLLKQPSEDPLGLEEYQELIKNITSSRGKMMRRLGFCRAKDV